MYNAILNGQEYRIDMTNNRTNLMIDCISEYVQFSCIADNSAYNMIDIALPRNHYKDELLSVFKKLIDVIPF